MKRPLRDLILYCDRGSDSVAELRRRLNGRRLHANVGARLRATAGALVINYGTSHSPNWTVGQKSIVLNPPDKVLNAISKVKTHELLAASNVPRLEQTVDPGLASTWLQEDSGVLCRRDGLSGGRGITYVPKGSPGPLPKSDFYTKYFPKTHEYRAHVFRGRLIDLTQKRLKNGHGKAEDTPAEAKIVRSLDNGWVHAHTDMDCNEERRLAIGKAAISAVSALGLDFGAVDILLYVPLKGPRKGTDVLAVAEVNTAPGLGNEETLKAYEEAIHLVYSSTVADRAVPVRHVRKRVRKQVLVWITTRKGNKVQRLRDRWVRE